MTCNRSGASVLSDIDGQIAYDLEDFCKEYGHPSGRSFTFEVTCDAVTYVYADIVGMVHAGGSDLRAQQRRRGLHA